MNPTHFFQITKIETDMPIENETSRELSAKQTKEKPFECTFCHMSFQESSSLKSHVRIHTGEVPFGCITCHKRYKTKGELKQHERIHTGEMHFECKTCKKRFNQPSIFFEKT